MKVIVMFRVSRFAPAFEAVHPAAGLGWGRRALRTELQRVARQATRLAALLEVASAPACNPAARVDATRPNPPIDARGVRLVEAVVGVVLAAYFAASLLAVFFG
jgi:hypothetical protein